MAVTKRLRYEVLRRDNHACRYCGSVAPETELQVDHVVPVALGGKDEPSNLVTACADCNRGKSSVPADAPLISDVAQDAVRWALAIRRATDEAIVARTEVMDVTHKVLDILSFADRFLPVNANDSIEQFMRNGLHADEVTDSAYTALGTNHIKANAVWRYFCGVCWRKIDRRFEAAKALVTADEAQHDNPTGQNFPSYVYAELAAVCDGRRA